VADLLAIEDFGAAHVHPNTSELMASFPVPVG
jgi:hypothetical protein